ncbi:MAG: SGNH/GDSL hydrolase family protein [Dermatophilaceae bacterium]
MTLARATAPRVWSRYVAIGDSFTEGLCDLNPHHPDRYAGWADRLAAHLAGIAEAGGVPLHYANLAVRGRLLQDVVGPQLDAALTLGPDLVSIVGGGNDILRNHTDVDVLAQRLEGAVAAIRATGADVLMATPVDPKDAPFIRRTRSRVAAYAADIWGIANRYRCHVIDQWGLRALRDWRMWAEDRIHLSSEGHRRVALAALDALGHPTDVSEWRVPLEPLPPVPRYRQLAADTRWVGTHLAPWLARRVRGRSGGAQFQAKHDAFIHVAG